MNKYEDIESQETFAFAHNDSQAQVDKLDTYSSLNPRIGFIRKVYGILCFQLLLTILLCLAAMYSPSYFEFMLSGAGLALMICAIVLTIVITILLFCCFGYARKVPTNYILLTIFTICEGYLVSYSCAATDPKIVFMAAIMTLGITVSLTIYAMTTKSDFTYMGGCLFVFGMVFCLVGIFMLFTANPYLHVIYAAIGVCFYGLYLIYDTQLIMGNKRHELSNDDYILGAIIIYLDIILIFLYLLELLDNLKAIFG